MLTEYVIRQMKAKEMAEGIVCYALDDFLKQIKKDDQSNAFKLNLPLQNLKSNN